jgi:hypothetical protein
MNVLHAMECVHTSTPVPLRHPREGGEQHVAAARVAPSCWLHGRARLLCPYDDGDPNGDHAGVRNECGGYDAQAEDARAVTRRAGTPKRASAR